MGGAGGGAGAGEAGEGGDGVGEGGGELVGGGVADVYVVAAGCEHEGHAPAWDACVEDGDWAACRGWGSPGGHVLRAEGINSRCRVIGIGGRYR